MRAGFTPREASISVRKGPDSVEQLIRWATAGQTLPHAPDQTDLLTLVGWIIGSTHEAQATGQAVAVLRGLARARVAYLRPGHAYSETIALFWITLAVRFVPQVSDRQDRLDAAASYAEAFAARSNLVYECYSRKLVHSWRATSGWVEPDLRPIESVKI